MKKLNTLIQYECMTSFKYIWMFYAIEYAIVLLIYIMVAALTGDPENAGTNLLELNTFIYIGILGALSYSEDFKMMIQNGFTRKLYFCGHTLHACFYRRDYVTCRYCYRESAAPFCSGL